MSVHKVLWTEPDLGYFRKELEWNISHFGLPFDVTVVDIEAFDY